MKSNSNFSFLVVLPGGSYETHVSHLWTWPVSSLDLPVNHIWWLSYRNCDLYSVNTHTHTHIYIYIYIENICSCEIGGEKDGLASWIGSQRHDSYISLKILRPERFFVYMCVYVCMYVSLCVTTLEIAISIWLPPNLVNR